MAQNSLPWTDGATGDAGPHPQDELRGMIVALAGGDDGVISALLGMLAASVNGSALQVQPGYAIVNGTVYWSTAVENLPLTLPNTGTTGWRLVLRKDWNTRTIRLVFIYNSDGNPAIPAALQNDGTAWDLSLATGTVGPGGGVVLTADVRQYIGKSAAILSGSGSTNSATPVDAGGVTVTVPVRSGRLMLWGYWSGITASGYLVHVKPDLTTETITSIGGPVSGSFPFTFLLTGLANGNHTFKLQVSSSGSGGASISALLLEV